MVRIESEFPLELLAGFVVLLSLPVKIAEAKMNVGLTGRNFRGRFELGNRFRSPSQTIQGFTHKDVSSGGIWALLLQLTKFFERAGIVLGPQAALRQQAMQFHVAGIRL